MKQLPVDFVKLLKMSASKFDEWCIIGMWFLLLLTVEHFNIDGVCEVKK